MSHHVFSFEKVSYQYPNGVEALCDISFTINHGEKVALVGANGAGKSTLILHTNGLLLPSSGCINMGNIELSKSTLPHIRQSVGIVFQNPDDQLFMPTVWEDVAFGPTNMNLSKEEIEHRTTQALIAVNALHLKDRAGYQLSGGQKKCVAIATVLSMEPNILVLDEPTANLDPKARRNIISLIDSFSHSCLIATHDMEMVCELCPRTIILSQGRIIADGATNEIFQDNKLLERAGLEAPFSNKFHFFTTNNQCF